MEDFEGYLDYAGSGLYAALQAGEVLRKAGHLLPELRITQKDAFQHSGD